MMSLHVDENSLRRLEENIRMLSSAGAGAMQDLVREQARLFQFDVVRNLPPHNRQRSRQLAASDVKRAFYLLPARGTEGPRSGKNSPILWVGVSRNALVGVRRDMVLRTYDLNRLLPAFRQSMARRPQPVIQQRGRQKVIIHQKPAITEHGARRLVNFLYSRFGRLKASFAKGWHELQKSRRLPEWVGRHVRTAKGVTEIADDPSGGSITFRSWAWGNAHPHAMRAIRAALMARIGATRARVRDLLSGYMTRRVKFRVRPGGRRMFR